MRGRRHMRAGRWREVRSREARKSEVGCCGVGFWWEEVRGGFPLSSLAGPIRGEAASGMRERGGGEPEEDLDLRLKTGVRERRDAKPINKYKEHMCIRWGRGERMRRRLK